MIFDALFSVKPCLFLLVIRLGFCGKLPFMMWFGVCGIPVISGFLMENLLISGLLFLLFGVWSMIQTVWGSAVCVTVLMIC